MEWRNQRWLWYTIFKNYSVGIETATMIFIRSYNIYEDKGNTEGDKAMSHPWKSRVTIVGRYELTEELTDMQNSIRYALEVAYEMAIHITIGYLRQLH
ncbi:MAG: hypothetical protein QW508_07355 [Conexivisphaerales archaeon]